MKGVFVSDNKCLSCHSCEIACSVAHSKSKTLFGAIGEEFPPQARIYVEPVEGGAFPIQCRHCSEPHCVKACVTKALHIDEATEAVLYEDKRCIGCTMCVLACPFGLIEKQSKPGGGFGVSKCDLCGTVGTEQVGKDTLASVSNPATSPYACVAACPTGALRFETVDNYSTDKRRAFLVEFTSQDNIPEN